MTYNICNKKRKLDDGQIGTINLTLDVKCNHQYESIPEYDIIMCNYMKDSPITMTLIVETRLLQPYSEIIDELTSTDSRAYEKSDPEKIKKWMEMNIFQKYENKRERKLVELNTIKTKSPYLFNSKGRLNHSFSSITESRKDLVSKNYWEPLSTVLDFWFVLIDYLAKRDSTKVFYDYLDDIFTLGKDVNQPMILRTIKNVTITFNE
jgi:hypothetical protein